MIGDELWAWQVLEDGGCGVIAAVAPGSGFVPLIHRNKAVAESMRPFAEEHSKESGLPVRLARFTLAEVTERIGGSGR